MAKKKGAAPKKAEAEVKDVEETSNASEEEDAVESTSKPEFNDDEPATEDDEKFEEAASETAKDEPAEEEVKKEAEEEPATSSEAPAETPADEPAAEVEEAAEERVDSVKAPSSEAETKEETESMETVTPAEPAATVEKPTETAEPAQSQKSMPETAPVEPEDHEVPVPKDITPTVAPAPTRIDLPAEATQPLDKRKLSDTTAAAPPATFARKASSGFAGLLGRMGRKTAQSPPASRQETPRTERRNTGQSATSVDGISLAGTDSHRLSLQDQFTTLRREQEYQMVHLRESDEDADAASMDKAADAVPTSPIAPSIALKSPPMDPKLPPGTAAGMTAGPAELPREVNWDLWQQVVYEGPAAVARTSGEELSQAIASGIPAAIRGVVWQVLAESKSEELEQMYRMLKARGTEAETRPSQSRSGSTVTAAAAESAISDASSVHSDHSTPAATPLASPPIAVDGPMDAQSKIRAEKQKRESAAIQKLEKAIKRDLGTRTSYSKYTQSAGLQDGLFGVCKAYALFDEGVGYAQGINFVAMPLLFNMSEEEAFTLLVRLMSKYDLRSLFVADMPGLHLRLYQFERLLEDFEPAVYCHLRRRQVSPQLYATQWFLTLFAYRFPLQLVLRVYDLIFSEGLTAILKFGIVLMQRNRAALLAMKDMSQLTTFLKEKIFDVYIDKSPSAASLLDSGFFGSVTGGADKELYRADEMVADACEITISDATLAKYTAEWEEQQRTEREREQELEGLRTAHATLTARVKSLEEHRQQSDAEHVTMAQDLVRLKVENDGLADGNEALRLQVAELRALLERTPAEVEARLREEMDTIMQRNIAVQEENRRLKEEMDEMEHTLVNVKMLHAQSQTDHDTLKQKWLNMQALLNDHA